MNGYSVEEAAEVLGIPQGRVWELIARGVLAGATEGGASMRVFLKGSPSHGLPPEPEPDATNGHGRRANGESHAELSPFRELLTEFRSLTERYGQALLALGEARGEVASLRSRVDLLEARMDMRLPLRAASTVAWEMPELQPAAAPEPPRPAASDDWRVPVASSPTPDAQPHEAIVEPSDAGLPETIAAAEAPPAPPEPPADPSAPATEGPQAEARPRRSSSRIAIANLAEALARAEDPALAALPGAQEAAEALAALHRQVEATAAEDEPRPEAGASPEEGPPPVVDEEPELLADLDAVAAVAPSIELAEEPELETPVAAEPEPQPPVAAAPESPYSTDVIEPDWFADGDFSWLDAPAEPEPPAAEPEPMEVEDASEATPAPEGDAPHLASSDELPVAEGIQDAFDEPMTEPEPIEPDQVTEPVAEGEPAAWSVPEPGQPSDADALGGEEAPAPAPDEVAPGAAVPEIPEEAPRTEAIAIEIDEPRADVGGMAPSPPEARISGFGLYRGQPEGPQPRAAAESRPATAVRDEEALMWLGDEFEAGDLEVAAPGWRGEERRPEPHDREAPPLQLSDAEIEQLASSEGWDRDEVEAIRGLLGRPATRAPEEEAPRAPADDPGTGAAAGLRPEPPAPRPLPIRPVDEQEAADWLRNRRGPAANAYRRLRRIFQG